MTQREKLIFNKVQEVYRGQNISLGCLIATIDAIVYHGGLDIKIYEKFAAGQPSLDDKKELLQITGIDRAASVTWDIIDHMSLFGIEIRDVLIDCMGVKALNMIRSRPVTARAGLIMLDYQSHHAFGFDYYRKDRLYSFDTSRHRPWDLAVKPKVVLSTTSKVMQQRGEVLIPGITKQQFADAILSIKRRILLQS